MKRLKTIGQDQILTLTLILTIALALRLIGVKWDQSIGLHPDERMIVLVVERISLSNLNPDFFSYGNLPIYLLKIISEIASLMIKSDLNTYANRLIIGRIISAFFDTATVFLVFKIAKEIWHEKVGYWASFIYATTVFAVQNAHFYTVDTQLTFWITLVLYLAIKNFNSSKIKIFLKLGLVIGLAAATKITGVLTLIIPFSLMIKNFLSQRVHSGIRFKAITKNLLLPGLLTGLAAATLFILTQPFVILESNEFYRQINEQLKMSRDATVFPYTYQFLNTTAYLTPLIEILRWGMGYPTAIINLSGFLFICYKGYIAIRSKKPVPGKMILLIGFSLFYFLLFGRSAVKFMRYYLPLYPFLAIAGGVFVCSLKEKLATLASTRMQQAIVGTILILLLVWPLSFLRIYLNPHPRILATKWMNENLPAGSTLAIEHWDDVVPLFNLNNFRFETLEVYNPETQSKWQQIDRQLERSDYLIISSNRVYRAITSYPEKYPITTNFYGQLFGNQTSFKLIRVFDQYPGLPPIGEVWATFNDSSAPPSFTIYDHPQVLIYAKSK